MFSEYHVSPQGDDALCGNQQQPFATITRAAAIAAPGDHIIVHSGVYREQVDPKRGGLDEHSRIVYRAAEGEPRPVIKGSEIVQGWIEDSEHPKVWSVVVPNALFGDFNPFKEIIFGDWLEDPKRGINPDKHLGDVYVNGRSCYEVTDIEEVYDPQERCEVQDFALKITHPILDSDQTRFVWYATVDEHLHTTTIWANFQEFDPNSELVEISVRRACFFPSRNHVNYITVRGFEMAQAACDWAPPTSAQWGMIGPNWSFGWIIEDNILHDAKFSAVSLGKEVSTGDNDWFRTDRKSGYQYQLEAVFKARRIGWAKGQVGSHIVRNNDIFDCGQNAIVGHMGCAFSVIRNNHVHRIGTKHEFFGWEVAGIKFHAALDTVIEGNNIHECSLGMWMDWQTQGTRISRNVFHHNVRDLMIEVSHGPYMVDNNVFASPIMFQDWAQGGAFVNNLICGSIDLHVVLDRSTPYHYPHTTDVAGTAVVVGGDEHYANNVFAPQQTDVAVGQFGLIAYSQYPSSQDEYRQNMQDLIAKPSQGGGEFNPLQQIFESNNVYFGCAQGRKAERLNDGDSLAAQHLNMSVNVVEKEDGFYVDAFIPEELVASQVPVITTAQLGTPRLVEEQYEHADGTPYVLNIDLCGQETGPQRRPGAIEHVSVGQNHIKVWPVM